VPEGTAEPGPLFSISLHWAECWRAGRHRELLDQRCDVQAARADLVSEFVYGVLLADVPQVLEKPACARLAEPFDTKGQFHVQAQLGFKDPGAQILSPEKWSSTSPR